MAETLTVTVDDGGTYTIDVRGVALFSDTGLTSPVSFPQSVAATTTWYAATPGKPGARANIEVLVTASDGTTIPVQTFTSLPATVELPEGTVDFASPAPSGGSTPGAGDRVGLYSNGVSLASGSMIDLVTNQESYAPQGTTFSYNATTGVVTVNNDCLAGIDADVTFDDATDATYRLAQIAVHSANPLGGQYAGGSQSGPALNGGGMQFSPSLACIRLYAGDTIKLKAEQDSGAGLNTVGEFVVTCIGHL